MTDDTHGPYTRAVMTALGELAVPAKSWAQITPDLEIVITLARNRSRAAGWKSDLIIYWDQSAGWHWAVMLEEDVSSIPRQLLAGVVVADPDAVKGAVQVLLSGKDGYQQLPLVGDLRPPIGPVDLTPAMAEALRDLPHESALDLAAYAA
ncbi:DUF6292 family protein [Streptomyces sp. NPDC055036]